MSRILLIIIVMVFIVFPGITQDVPTFDDFEESFAQFADGVASTLPFNALVGLSWSDTHINNFPHFGLGVTIGATFMPYVNLEKTLSLLGVDPSQMGGDSEIGALLTDFGMPFPAVYLEGRLGGFFLPFDMGIKIGYIPSDFDLTLITDGFGIDYFSIGGDVRFRVLKQWFMVPGINVGGGLTYQRGSIDVPGILGSNMALDIDGSGTFPLELQDPSLNFNWKTLVADIKTQMSWDLFLLTPYIGGGASYSLTASAGGGIKSEIYNTNTGQPLTQSDIDNINDYFDFIGETPPDLSGTQILVSSDTPSAWAFRVYGGVSVNFFILRLDATLMYNFMDGGLGGSINGRFQF